MKIQHYRSKMSGPLMDRIDLHVEVPRVNFQLLSSKTESLSSAQMREQVEFALQLQKRRYAHFPITFNSELQGKQLRSCCELSGELWDCCSVPLLPLGLVQEHTTGFFGFPEPLRTWKVQRLFRLSMWQKRSNTGISIRNRCDFL